ncbi:helix-turn-helix domain-containing protein [Pantoea sp. 18069]|uniref:helix-turn-helix domain-containing protein n=1 Tax=Pantoea sp. 18069 TaxID=2681415 RepID=UPI00135B8833|nr:helix-turn-helix domain-containing protein [Pantoea sp. 18069]
MNTIQQVSGELRAALRRSGLTQQAVRDAAGVSRQTFANVVGGEADYKLSTLLAIADRLGLELLLVPKGAARGLQRPSERPVESLVDRARKQLGLANDATKSDAP